MSLAIFDLDGTLIKGQSQGYFARYLLGKGKIRPFKILVILLWFLGFKLRLVRNPEVMMKYGFSSLAGQKETEAVKMIAAFYDKILVNKFNPEILEKLKKHQSSGDRVVIMSNAAEPLVSFIGKKLGIDEVIATRLETKDGVYTGRIEGEIVYGEGKAAMAREAFSEEELKTAYAYADHYSDEYLLDLVGNPVKV